MLSCPYLTYLIQHRVPAHHAKSTREFEETHRVVRLKQPKLSSNLNTIKIVYNTYIYYYQSIYIGNVAYLGTMPVIPISIVIPTIHMLIIAPLNPNGTWRPNPKKWSPTPPSYPSLILLATNFRAIGSRPPKSNFR